MGQGKLRAVLQDGSIVTAARDNAFVALFWALRGGTGNNFGVLLEVVFRLYNRNIFWEFGIRWSLDNAPAALAMFGMYDGSVRDGLAILQLLLATPGAHLFIDQIQTYAYLNEHLLDDNLYPPPPDAGLIEFKKPGYMDFFVDSFFFESGTPTSRKQTEERLDAQTYGWLCPIKTKYDPDNFFRFEQSIPPSTDPGSIKKVNLPSFVKRFQTKAKTKRR